MFPSMELEGDRRAFEGTVVSRGENESDRGPDIHRKQHIGLLLGGYEFGLEIESVLGKFENTIYNDI